MFYRFEYTTPLDMPCPESEIVQCDNYNQATEVAHRLAAIWWEHKRNLHTELTTNQFGDFVTIRESDFILGIIQFSELTTPPKIRTANDIATVWRKVLEL